MKKIMRTITGCLVVLCLAAGLMALTAVPVKAESGTCGGNLTWTLDEDGTLTISGSGEMYDYDFQSSPFYNNGSISNVVIEDGVTSIGSYAFCFCRSLNNITIPESVTSIGYAAFFGCTELKSITIPEGVTSIGSEAFLDCSSLTSVTIPDSVTSIGSKAFSNCSRLTSITIPDSISSIGSQVFLDCSSLTSVTIPENFTSISYGMFQSCSSLTSIDIPDSVTSISKYAFALCSSLESITIPKGVTSMEDFVFLNCYSLENILVEQGNQNYSSMGGVLFNSDQTVLVFYPSGREGGYAIPDSVTSIGSTAFANCSNLTSITIPDGAINIGNDAFFGCLGLTDITIPDKVTSIGSSAFQACSNLTSITIPDSVTSIGKNAFNGCSNLVIYCCSGSKAQEYAEANNIPFKTIIHISKVSVTIPDQLYTYTGAPLKPNVTVNFNGTQLIEDTDYEVAYSRNIDAGSDATVTVTGMGDYGGKKKLTFTIEKARQTITASDMTLPYPESRKITVTGNQGRLSYMSSVPSVAEVDTSGNVTAKKVDKATITITAAETKNYQETKKEITVTVVKGTQFITASDLSLTYPESGSISVSGNKGDLTYESSNTAIATVDTAGKVTAVGVGPAMITITAAGTDNYNSATKTITVNIAKADQEAPAAPEAEKATSTSIKLKEIKTGEYRCGDGEWQDSPEFTGLTKDTEYTFSQRVKADDNHNASQAVSAKIRTAKTYKVTYEVTGESPDGAPKAPEDKNEYEEKDEVTVKDALSMEGYTFSGWNSKDVSPKDGKFAMPAKDVTLTGSWKVNQHVLTVLYEYADGKKAVEQHTENVDYGAEYAVASPEIKGYTASQKTVKGTMGDKDVTVKVIYGVNTHTLTVSYKYADGKKAADTHTEKLDYGVKYTVASPEIKGYTADQAAVTGTMGDKDVSVDVTYGINTYTLTVNYKYADGKKAADTHTEKLDYGVKYTVASPEIKGYTADQATVTGTMSDQDVSIDVVYTANEYILSFDTDGGSEIKSVTLAYGAAVKAPADPAKDGYTFSGWDPALPTIMPAEDMTVKAKWTKVKEPEPEPEPEPEKKVSGTLLTRMTAKGNKSLVLTWSKVKGAEGYDIFFTGCGTTLKNKVVRKIKGNKTFTWTKKKLLKGKKYKAYVKAWVKKDGKKTYVKKSPAVHAFTANGNKKYTNPKSITVKKKKITLKAGKSYAIKAKINKIDKKKSLMKETHGAALRYCSSNTKIAKVSSKGKITAKAPGKCKVYVYAINGVSKTIRVTVKEK